MRLLNTATLAFEEFFETDTPAYAILSHTWTDGEATHRDVVNSTGTDRPGWRKIQSICKLARRDDYHYIWIDTCCIDKTSSAELSEAINSMYAYFTNATVCYAYIVDAGPSVHLSSDAEARTTFTKSRWFTRGWTLMELIAPPEVIFLDNSFGKLGTRSSLSRLVASITGIDEDLLRRKRDIEEYTIAQRMSWAASRSTTRTEDTAYCLMGLFGVNMPIMYGEGDRAFLRLQEGIMEVRSKNDESIFAWNTDPPFSYREYMEDTRTGHRLLAKSPGAFANYTSPAPHSDKGDSLYDTQDRAPSTTQDVLEFGRDDVISNESERSDPQEGMILSPVSGTIEDIERTDVYSDSGYASMPSAASKEMLDNTDRMTILSAASTVEPDPMARDRLVVAFVEIISNELGDHSLSSMSSALDLQSNLTRHLEIFAKTLGLIASTDGEVRTVRFLRQQRRRIAQELLLTEDAKSETSDETDRPVRKMAQADLSEWLDAQTDTPAPEETPLQEEDHDEGLDIVSQYIREARPFISNSDAFRWLVDRVSAAIHLTESEQLKSIPNMVLQQYVGKAVNATSLKKPGAVQSVVLHVDWDPLVFLRKYHRPQESGTLIDVLTLNRHGNMYQALTCIEYMEQTWRSSGEETAKALQTVLSSMQLHNLCQGSVSSAEFTLDLSIHEGHTYVKATGPILRILDLIEQFCWLAAACRLPNGDGWCMSTSEIVRLEHEQGSPVMDSFAINVRQQALDRPPLGDDLCWTELLQNSNFTDGFPILQRLDGQLGLELAFSTMIALSGATRINTFDSKVVVKAFSCLFVAVKQTVTSTIWHMVTSTDNRRISYCETSNVRSASNLDITCLQSCRHFLGWSDHTMQEIGTKSASYAKVSRSTADPRSGIRLVLSNISISAGKYATAGASVTTSHRQATLAAGRAGPLEVKVDEMSKIYVLLYDDQTRRVWLVDGASAVLHLLRFRLSASPYNSSTLFNISHFTYAESPGGASQSVAALLKNRDHQLFEKREKTVEISGSVASTKIKVSYWTAEDVILEFWDLLEQMFDHQNKVRAGPGVELHATYRDSLEGWYFNDLAEGQPRLQATSVRLHPSGRGWVDFTRGIQAVTLVGRGFGDVIRNLDATGADCPHWTQAPSHQDYLIVRLELLRQICTVCDDLQSSTLKLAKGAYWHKAHSLFERCDCALTRKQQGCDRVQVLLPRRTAGAKHHPGDDVLRSSDHDQAAVIFGRSAFWRWKWDNDGDPYPEERNSENDADSGIGMSDTTPNTSAGASSRIEESVELRATKMRRLVHRIFGRRPSADAASSRSISRS